MFDSFEYKDNQGVSLSIWKDIFDHVQVNDGRGNKVDVGRDIFGDLQVKIIREINGAWNGIYSGI